MFIGIGLPLEQQKIGPAIIGGLPIGTAGSGFRSGYTLAGGDDYNGPLDIMGTGKTGGKYLTAAPTAAVTRIRSSPNNQRFNGDPLTTGWLDANRGVPVGLSDIFTQSNGILTLKSRISTSPEQALCDSKGYIFATCWSTPFITFTAPAILEFYVFYPTGMPEGVHATVWCEQGNPANANVGNALEFDLMEGGSQYPGFSVVAHGTVTGWTGTSTTTSMQSLNLYGAWHLVSVVLDTSGAALYVDGTLFHTYTGDTTVVPVPWHVIFTNVQYNQGWNGDSGINATAWNAAGAAGAPVQCDYYRIWIPNAKYPSQIIKPSGTLPTAQVAYNGSVNYTFPSWDSVFGAGNYDSVYAQAIRIEDYEPGGSTVQSSAYGQFPAGLSLSGQNLTGTLTTPKPGRMNLVAIPTKAGGSVNYTAKGFIDFGPNITTTTLNATVGTPFSYDLYPDCDCGQLLPKAITCTGLPSGLSFSSTTGLITGTPTISATSALSIGVTNSSGQTVTVTPNIVVAAASGSASVAFTGSGVFSPTDRLLDSVSVSFVGSSTFSPSTSTIPDLLDGTAISSSSTTQSLTSATFTTTYAGDALVIGIQCGRTAGAFANTVASVTDSTGLTWTKQVAQLFNGGTPNGEISIWTAKASSGSPYSGTVTVNLNTASAYQMRFFLCAFSNPNATLLDPNGGNPVSNDSSGSSTQTSSAVISTSNAKDIIFGLICSNVSLGTVTRPSGFTQVISAGTAADFSYKIVTSTQSSVTETWSWTGTAAPNAVAVLALQFAS